jgi:hypothetical protein
VKPTVNGRGDRAASPLFYRCDTEIEFESERRRIVTTDSRVGSICMALALKGTCGRDARGTRIRAPTHAGGCAAYGPPLARRISLQKAPRVCRRCLGKARATADRTRSLCCRNEQRACSRRATLNVPVRFSTRGNPRISQTNVSPGQRRVARGIWANVSSLLVINVLSAAAIVILD